MEIFDMFDIEYLKSILPDNIVTFKYQKKNGNVRIAMGTLNQNVIESHLKNNDTLTIPFDIMDILISEHGYKDVHEYAEHNEVNLIDMDDKNYIFRHVKRPKSPSTNTITYFDLEKNEMRSFINENYLGTINVKPIN